MNHAPSRRLYLVRHGEAKSKEEDPQRGLTDAGRLNVSRMATWAATAGVQIEEVRHSGKLRAQQTAEIIAEYLRVQAQTISGLAPNDDVSGVAAEIESEERDIMLVGHLPMLERLAALLTVGNIDSGVVTLEAGALLELTAADGVWRVTCLMHPHRLST